MRLPRVRFTVRRMMLVIVAVAAALVLVREFEEGIPPRYVLRGIPARIGQLRPGLTRGQTYEVLGLNSSWLWGGISARSCVIEGGAHRRHETHFLRALRPVAMNHQGDVYLKSSGMIYLRFHDSPGWTPGREDDSAQLELASFSDGNGTIAEMPGTR